MKKSNLLSLILRFSAKDCFRCRDYYLIHEFLPSVHVGSPRPGPRARAGAGARAVARPGPRRAPVGPGRRRALERGRPDEGGLGAGEGGRQGEVPGRAKEEEEGAEAQRQEVRLRLGRGGGHLQGLQPHLRRQALDTGAILDSEKM